MQGFRAPLGLENIQVNNEILPKKKSNFQFLSYSLILLCCSLILLSLVLILGRNAKATVLTVRYTFNLGDHNLMITASIFARFTIITSSLIKSLILFVSHILYFMPTSQSIATYHTLVRFYSL